MLIINQRMAKVRIASMYHRNDPDCELRTRDEVFHPSPRIWVFRKWHVIKSIPHEYKMSKGRDCLSNLRKKKKILRRKQSGSRKHNIDKAQSWMTISLSSSNRFYPTE